eukprot:CAMPEP_0179084088 /NCGR_PEP_ID=MMETSP0796-20121207/38007_1 /TAXON_ID=73915 /ORGANISM="Pyrodinium bahamense, Strain pbaha01" /LENGTH=32 /DNA_ID= /DNA_START= /DNA_END= /DNA_ORIENTATION=
MNEAALAAVKTPFPRSLRASSERAERSGPELH